jgi:hypothetical protein
VRGLLCPTVIGREHELTELDDAIREAMAARGSATFTAHRRAAHRPPFLRVYAQPGDDAHLQA